MTVRAGLPMGSTAVNLFYFSDLKIYIVLKVNCNHIFKWVSTNRFWGPDHRLYLQLFYMTPLTLVIPIKKICIAL